MSGHRSAWIIAILAVVAVLALLTVQLGRPGASGAQATCTIDVPGDQATIQGAVTAASPGDVICVDDSTYTESVDIATADLTLQGAQASVDARTRDVGSTAGESVVDGSFNLDANGIIVDGFYITGDEGQVIGGVNTSPTASGYQVINNIITENDTGIRLWSDGATQTVVRHNWLDKNHSDAAAPDARGIFLGPAPLYEPPAAAASNVLIEENRFTDHTGGGSPTSVHLGQGVEQTNIVIRGNEFTNDGTVTVMEASNITIEGNAFSGGAESTTRVFVGGDAHDVSIWRNSFVDAPGWAVQLMQLVPGDNTGVEVQFNSFTGSGSGGAGVTEFNELSGHDGPVLATYNWWGDLSGPGGEGPGTGDDVTVGVTFDPWIAALELDPASATLGVGETFNIDATLLDNDGAAVPGSELQAHFVRTGANPGDSDESFSAGGVASHSFEAMLGDTDVGVQPLFAGVLAGPTASGAYTAAESDIAITKSVNPSSASPGDTVTFTIAVTNADLDAPQGTVEILDTFPGELNVTNATGDDDELYTCNVTGQAVTCENSGGPHVAGDEHTITITATVDADAPLGGYSNDATAELDGVEVSEATAPFAVIEPDPDTRVITVEKLVEGADAPALDEVTGTIEPHAPSAWTIHTVPGTTMLINVSTSEQTVTEDDPGTGWTADYAVMSGIADCDAFDGTWSTNAAVVPEGSDDARVCIRNTYEAPSPGEPETHAYTLRFRWTLLGWLSPDMDVEDALRGEGANAGGDDIHDQVTVVWSWDSVEQDWDAYFPGEDPSASDLESFQTGIGYWIATEGPGDITWEVVVAPGDDG